MFDPHADKLLIRRRTNKNLAGSIAEKKCELGWSSDSDPIVARTSYAENGYFLVGGQPPTTLSPADATGTGRATELSTSLPLHFIPEKSVAWIEHFINVELSIHFLDQAQPHFDTAEMPDRHESRPSSLWHIHGWNEQLLLNSDLPT
jgi:hypothetical protein